MPDLSKTPILGRPEAYVTLALGSDSLSRTDTTRKRGYCGPPSTLGYGSGYHVADPTPVQTCTTMERKRGRGWVGKQTRVDKVLLVFDCFGGESQLIP